MTSSPRTALLALSAALTLGGVARADVPPPDDYVDPCKSAALDESCERCVSPEFKNPECHAKAREAGLVQRCQGWSYAMYCREGAAAKPAEGPSPAEPAAEAKPTEAPAATPAAAGCRVAAAGGWALPGALLLVVAALGRGARRGRGRGSSPARG